MKDRGAGKKQTEQNNRRRRAKKQRARKAFTIRLPHEKYVEFCQIAGRRSLSEQLESMLPSAKTRVNRNSAPT